MRIKFLLPVFILLTACSLFKDTEAFKKAQSFLEAHPVVQEKIGKINHYGNPAGSYKLNGNFGNAQFSFNIKGEKAEGDVNIQLEKTSFDWEVKSAWLKMDDAEQINLLLTGSSFAFFHSYFSDERWGAPKNPARFKAGQAVFFQAQSRGAKPDDKGIVYAQLDIELTTPGGEIKKEEAAIKGPTEAPDGYVDVYYGLDTQKLGLTADAKPYQFKFILWDLQNKEKAEVSGEFYLEN